MKEYRITSENFVLPGETGEQDAVMDSADLARIKKLAGLVTEDYYEAGGHDPFIQTPNDSNTNRLSPVGSNIPGANKRTIEKQQNIKVGSDEWFKLWFAKPELTGEKPVGDAPAPKKPNPEFNNSSKVKS